MKSNSFTRGGKETRYDNDLGGNHIERIRKTGWSTGLALQFGKRFCETCKKVKPSDKTKAIKGWKCKDCKQK